MADQTLDIFNNDAFGITSMTAAINDAPHQPGRLGQLGWFEEEGIASLTFWLERQGNALKLIPNQPRGARGVQPTINRSNAFLFGVSHLPQSDSVFADEVAGVREFGTANQLKTVQSLVNKRLENMRSDIDATLEYHRIGAMLGKIMDADGTTVLEDLLARFNMTRQTMSLGLSGTGDIQVAAIGTARAVENALGGVRHTTKRAICSSGFFDAFLSNKSVKEAYKLWSNSGQLGEFLRNDPRGGFFFAGVFWEEYRGQVGGVPFIPEDKAYLVPEGVPGMFQTKFGFANYIETVNTVGLPYYAKMEAMDMGKGMDIEAQSNPGTICTRPDAIIELTP